MKLGVIGLGYWGPNLARNISATPGVELAALCDVDGTQLEMQSQLYPGVRAATSATEILEDPSIEAVAIATPISTLFGLAKQALLADKHVLVEKPMAATVHEAEELVALAAQRDRVLMVDHPYVYSPAVQKLAELNREGELGKSAFHRLRPDKPWPGTGRRECDLGSRSPRFVNLQLHLGAWTAIRSRGRGSCYRFAAFGDGSPSFGLWRWTHRVRPCELALAGQDTTSPDRG